MTKHPRPCDFPICRGGTFNHQGCLVTWLYGKTQPGKQSGECIASEVPVGWSDFIVSCVNAIGDRDPAAVVRLVEWAEKEPAGLNGHFTNATAEWCAWFREVRHIAKALHPKPQAKEEEKT